MYFVLLSVCVHTRTSRINTNAFFDFTDLQVWRSCTPLRQFSVSTAGRSSSAPPKSELASDLLATLERRGVPWNLLFRMPSHELGELVVRTGQSGVRGYLLYMLVVLVVSLPVPAT
jgi:hypothetical protein